MTHPSHILTCRRVSLTCCWIAAIIGGITIIGWVTGIEALASVRSNYIPMAPSTALGFALIGFAVIARSGSRLWRLLSIGSVTAVTLLASAKLLEFFGGFSLGLEERLVADPAMFGTVRKGRMAPLTALNFLVASFATLSLMHRHWQRWTGTAAAMVCGINLVVLLGYMHGTPLLYGGDIIPVALPTAVAFLFFGEWIGSRGRSAILAA